MKTKSVSSVSASAPARPAGGVGAAAGAGGADFAALLAGQMAGSGDAVPAAASTAVNNVSGIMPGQAVGDGEQSYNRRKRTVKYGSDLLDRLEEIRQGLIRGIIPKDRLFQLSHKLRQRNVEEINEDPRLKEIIEEIETRVEVELAKLTRLPIDS